MQTLLDFIQKNFPEGTSIITPQFDREKPLEFQHIPANEAEFMVIVEKAPWDILKGYGFRKWDTMNNIIEENGSTTKQDIDEDVILFPAEWYDIIPDGFTVTDLWGEDESFKKGESDNDRRFGCLGYGIKRPINN